MQEPHRETGRRLSHYRAAPTLMPHEPALAVASGHAPAAPSYAGYPLELRWTGPHGPRPVPTRTLRLKKRLASPRLSPILTPETPNLSVGLFDFSEHMRHLCADIIPRFPSFHGMDENRILFGITQARNSRQRGLQAKVTPMRFRHGALTQRRRGRIYQVQRYWVDEVEILYLMTFCLPRFLNQTFEQKLITIFHELFHIDTKFDGDLRRHDGRYCLHSGSQKEYDAEMRGLAEDYVRSGTADLSRAAFLRLNAEELHARTDGIRGMVVPVPKLVPIGV